jgi:hypothetical protein
LTGVELYGGFSGTETIRSERDSDPYTNETVLSGDIGTPNFAGDNTYHVLTGSGVGPSAVLDGFTVTKGQANGTEFEDRDGGGVYNDTGSPTFRNCLFTGNRAQDDGGALYNRSQSSPSITDCSFVKNTADFGGGAIRNIFDSNPHFENVQFTGNSAGLTAGALSNFDSRPNLINVEFTDNVSGFSGGAIDNYDSSPILVNVRFAGNEADYRGGAMANDDSDPSITNALFSGNAAEDGGAVHNETSSPIFVNTTFSGNRAVDRFGNGIGGALANTSGSFPQIRNSILWGNRAAETGSELFIDESSQVLVGHTIVEGSLPDRTVDDGDNLSQAPLFETPVDAANAPTLAGDFRVLTNGAPGLDAADPTRVPADRFDLDGNGVTSEPLPVDLDGTPRLVDNNRDGSTTLDLGAYEAPPSVLPVELTFLDAEVDGTVVHLTWQTASETNNSGFFVQRLLGPRASRDEQKPGWTTLGFVDGHGTTSEAQHYRFSDPDFPSGTSLLSYRLKQIDLDGSTHYSEVVEVERALPTALRLLSPYPNPVRDRATIDVVIPEGRPATLSLYDITGREVRRLPNVFSPGEHSHALDTAGLASGIYILRLRNQNHSVSQKLTVVH